jgi:hypothetical protein
VGPAGRRKQPELTTVHHRAATEPLTGWRYWQLQPATGRLRSVTHRRFEWRPGTVLRAMCLIDGHDAPAPGCACGIHARPSLAELREEGLCLVPSEPLVAGEVSLWGTVVADDHGLRGELAAPARLGLVTPDGQVPDQAALAHLAAYGVPVDVLAPAEAMGEVAAAILAHQALSR